MRSHGSSLRGFPDNILQGWFKMKTTSIFPVHELASFYILLNFIFKGLIGQFKITTATQYITRIKDSTKNGIGISPQCSRDLHIIHIKSSSKRLIKTVEAKQCA